MATCTPVPTPSVPSAVATYVLADSGIPYSVAISPLNGNLYITDHFNDRIVVTNADLLYQTHFGVSGTSPGQLGSPNGIDFDHEGRIYVTEITNDRVTIYNSDHTYNSTFGSLGSGDDQFTNPIDIAVDTNGDLYIADANNNRVKVHSSTGVYQSQFVVGALVHGVDIGVDGSVWVSTATDVIYRYSKTGTLQGTFNTLSSTFNVMRGLKINNYGHLFICDEINDRFRKLTTPTEQAYAAGGTGSGLGQLDTPTGLTVAADGTIYVVDAINRRVQKFVP